MQMNDIAKTLSPYAQKIDFSGVASIYEGGKTLFHQAFGYRDIANKIPNDTDTRFGIASGTKLFTALGILKLVESGDLNLSTTVSSIFHRELSFIHPEATIQQLLCHTSGIFDYYDEELITDFENYILEIPWYRLETPSDYWPLFESQDKKYHPGQRVSYSNGGYVFLGVIIDKITGKLYRDFLSEQVLRLAGMTHSGFFALNSLPRNTANGYIATDQGQKTNIYQIPIRGGGDGGLYTNSSDLNRFWHSLFAGKIISKTLLAQLCHREVEIWEDTSYGLGIYISQLLNKDCFFITGSDAGVGFSSSYLPEFSLSINVLSNQTDGNDDIIEYILSKFESSES